jgi:serine O-acetyltransferase
MKTSLSSAALRDYVHRLLAHHLPDGYMPGDADMHAFALALERVEHCFSRIHRKYYVEAGDAVFDHLNGDHMATLLYFYANSAWRESGDAALPTRLFYLNKILHGLDLFYSVAMPEVFLLVHPLGTVLGHARYEDYLVVYQACTVGAVTDVYPCFGKGTIFYSRSSVIGNCTLGDNVVLAANAFVVDSDVPDNTVVVGQYPALRQLPNARSVRERCFDAPGATE